MLDVRRCSSLGRGSSSVAVDPSLWDSSLLRSSAKTSTTAIGAEECPMLCRQVEPLIDGNSSLHSKLTRIQHSAWWRHKEVESFVFSPAFLGATASKRNVALHTYPRTLAKNYPYRGISTPDLVTSQSTSSIVIEPEAERLEHDNFLALSLNHFEQTLPRTSR